MGEPIRMNTAQARMLPMADPGLTLAHWLSPAFPVGAFAYSHGLEAAIVGGQVRCPDSLQTWLRDVLEFGAGRTDCVLIRAAYASGDTAQVDAVARAFAASSERLRETTLQGAAFCRTLRDVWGLDLPDLVYPVALGRAAALQGLPLPFTCAMYLQAFSGNLVSAAVRLVPLGQTDGQRCMLALTPLFPSLSRETAAVIPDDLHGAAFLSDIAAMNHETLYTRIFRT
jgi:urease accessory protein